MEDTFLTAVSQKTVTLELTTIFRLFSTLAYLDEHIVKFYISANCFGQFSCNARDLVQKYITVATMPFRTVLGRNIFSITGIVLLITERYLLCMFSISTSSSFSTELFLELLLGFLQFSSGTGVINATAVSVAGAPSAGSFTFYFKAISVSSSESLSTVQTISS